MFVVGIVEKGLGIAGPLFGTPTANLKLDQLPDLPRGVYAAVATMDAVMYPAVVCFGADAERKKFEVHIIDWSGDLAGVQVQVEIVEKIHDMIPWESAEQMREIVLNDVAKAREILKNFM